MASSGSANSAAPAARNGEARSRGGALCSLLVALLVGCGGGGGDDSSSAVPRANSAPISDGGPSRSAFVGESVTLDAAASTDPDGDTLRYDWALVLAPDNSTATLGNASARQATLVLDRAGAYIATLTVDDGRGSRATSSVTIATVAQGRFLDSVVSGLEYTAGDRTGITDDSGAFNYPLGSRIEFRIGHMVLGSATAKPVISVLDLAPGEDASSQNTVINVARILQTLDDDADPSNGIQISAAVRAGTDKALTTAFAEDPQEFAAAADVKDAIAALGSRTQAGARPLVAADAAMQHLSATLLAQLAGKYQGLITGEKSGTWSIDIAPDGSITGSGASALNGRFTVSGSGDARGRLTMAWQFSESTTPVAATVFDNGNVLGEFGDASQGISALAGARSAATNPPLPALQCDGPTEYDKVNVIPESVRCDTDLVATFDLDVGPIGKNYSDILYREKLVSYFNSCGGIPPKVAEVGKSFKKIVIGGKDIYYWRDDNGVGKWHPSPEKQWASGCFNNAIIEDQWAFKPTTPDLAAKQAICKVGQDGYKTFARKVSLTSRSGSIVRMCKNMANGKGDCILFDLYPQLDLSKTHVEIPRQGTGSIPITVTIKPAPGATDTCRPWSIVENKAPFANPKPSFPARLSQPGTIILSAPANATGADLTGELTIGFAATGFSRKISIRQADPTFVQSSNSSAGRSVHGSASASPHLFARITLPATGDLVRADVPVFGLAYGNDFSSYRLEFGEGSAPNHWRTIATSSRPKADEVPLAPLLDSGDMTVVGNLGNWDTGLKEYVYLPSYPKDHPTDLRGTHTMRLVVEGLDGKTVEDRVTVHVANVIPNAWGAKVTSQDGRFTLAVPEQALMDSFRLVLAQPADGRAVGMPQGKQLIGRVYEVREPGERFTKEVTLDMAFEAADLAGTEPGRVAIHGYNADSKRWEQLTSVQRRSGHALTATLRTLHAYYALMAGDSQIASTPIEPAVTDSAQRLALLRTADGPYLVRNDFERDPGQWSNRDHEVGGTVSLDSNATFDGTKALKVTNVDGGGNFAVNVFNQPFDAREFPLVQFDYRIAAGVKTNFLVKVEGRWYEIRFTGEPRDLQGKRVNIASIGDIEGIVSDDRWHTASFNLYDMLRTRTRNTRVEAMIMADWDIGGYMKLQFGKNFKGASYYIDNFAIRREALAGLQVRDDRLLIDDFNQMKATNALGGATTAFSSAAPEQLKAAFAPRGEKGSGHALRIDYDLALPASYAGYVSGLSRVDLRDYQALTFLVKRSVAEADLLVGLSDRAGHESKVRLTGYLPQRSSADWQRVSIPAAAFVAIKDWAGIENLSLSFERDVHSKGSVQIDDVAFEKQLTQVAIDDFERPDGMGSMGQGRWTFASGAAAINGQVVHNSPNGVYRMVYGGNIGAKDAVTGELKSFAGWATNLGGIDCTRCDALNFRLRGAEGGEELTVYLSDGNFRWGVPLIKDAGATSDWRVVSIPMQAFAEYGVDLTHLAELQFAFEGRETSRGEKTSGTVYVDDIRFGPPAGQ